VRGWQLENAVLARFVHVKTPSQQVARLQKNFTKVYTKKTLKYKFKERISPKIAAGAHKTGHTINYILLTITRSKLESVFITSNSNSNSFIITVGAVSELFCLSQTHPQAIPQSCRRFCRDIIPNYVQYQSENW
jgi:hypothetical protein